MNIKRSTYYYQKKANIAKIQQEILLKGKNQQIAFEYSYYGYWRITAQLHRQKIRVNHKRVLRIKRQLGIQANIKRRYSTTAHKRHSYCIQPNIIKEKTITSINQICCSDITYIRIITGFVCLVANIDIYFRRIMGYAMGRNLSPELTLAALKIALSNRKIGKLIHHSDQGIQNAFSDYIKLLK
jgi:putative transposase